MNSGEQDNRTAELLFVFRDETQRPVFGPAFEMQFPRRFGVEFSPTYRRTGSSQFSDFIGTIPETAVPRTEFVGRSAYFRNSTQSWDLLVTGSSRLRAGSLCWSVKC